MPTRFPLVLRGYDCREVDDLLRQAEDALASGRSPERADALAALRGAAIRWRFRGYDRVRVDRVVEDLITELS